MSARASTYSVDDPEKALKYAIQHVQADRVQIVEGVITRMSRSWSREGAATEIRRQIEPVAETLGCLVGAGDLDLPGTPNWYIPDVAVVPKHLADDAGALVPDQTLFIAEVTSDFHDNTDGVVKRRRYAEYGAPLYLLVDRQERSCTLFSKPTELGYTRADGPHPFGTPIHLPAPFDLELDTSEF